MRIVCLEIENVKGLKSVRIDPPGHGLVIIKGNNGAGKSSVLDSLLYLFAGGRTVPKHVIREGCDEGRIHVDCGDYVIEKRWTEGGKHVYLEVRTAEGESAKSPQSLLNSLFSRVGFDPLAFAQMSAKEQVETLQKIGGLDFTEHDTKRKNTFDERTVVNRELKTLEARLKALPVVNAPNEEQSAADLSERYNALGRLKAKREAVASIDERIEHAKKQLAQLETDREMIVADGKALSVELGKPKDLTAAMTEVQTQLADIDEVNRKVRQKRDRLAIAKQVKENRARSDDLSTELKDLDEAKKKAIEDADFPEGLSFDDEGVLLLSRPIAVASSAEQLKASVAVGLLLNPELRVLTVREGSLLDDASMETLDQSAIDNDAQILVERVGDHDDTGILLEAGEVVRVDEEDESAFEVSL